MGKTYSQYSHKYEKNIKYRFINVIYEIQTFDAEYGKKFEICVCLYVCAHVSVCPHVCVCKKKPM